MQIGTPSRPRPSTRGCRCAALSMVVALGAACAASPVLAAFPGSNGKIAYQSDRDGRFQIYAMESDGTAQTRLTTTSGHDNDPAWSPDGSKIAFHTDRDGDNEIFVMSADGSGQTAVTVNSDYDVHPSWAPDGARIAFQSARDGSQEIYVTNLDGSGQTRLTTSGGEHPAWSPDGSKIAFASLRDGNHEIYVMNSDGTGQTRLTSNTAEDEFPHWGPDGSRLAFYSDRDGDAEIYTMNPDGSALTKLTDNTTGDFFPAFSPDGTKIAFQRDGGSNAEIYVMNTDGSGQTRLTDNTAFDHLPDWQPLAAPPPPPPPATLELSPMTATNRAGEQHCVTATVEDAFGNATPDVAVRFSVSGANSASGSQSTDASGQASFCYTGELVGGDSIAAFADSDGSTTQSPGEPGDTASKTYVAPPSTDRCRVSNGGRITATGGDKATFGGNAQVKPTPKGEQTYQDHGPATPVSLKSIAVLAVTCNGTRTRASIFGTARVGIHGSVDFRIDLADNGEPGSDDTFRIRLGNGYDSGEQKLEGGNVQIHK